MVFPYLKGFYYNKRDFAYYSSISIVVLCLQYLVLNNGVPYLKGFDIIKCGFHIFLLDLF
jgi:hypothetical protein